MKDNSHPVADVMNYFVSGYVYFVAFTLVLYMVSSFITGVLGLVTGLLDISSSAKVLLAAPERPLLEQDMLHTIAFTIVHVKAYTILNSTGNHGPEFSFDMCSGNHNRTRKDHITSFSRPAML